MRTALRRLLLPLDAVVAALLLVVRAPALALAARRARRAAAEDDRRLVLTNPGASLAHFERTKGDFRWHLEGFAAGGYFRRVTHLFFPSPPAERVVERERDGVLHVYVERRAPLGLFHLTGAARVVLDGLRAAAAGGRTVVRGTDPYLHGLVAWAIARLAGAPFSISVHTDHRKYSEISGRPTYAVLPSRRLLDVVGRFVYRRADLVWAVNGYIRRACVRDGCDEAKIRVVYHAVPEGIEAPPEEAAAFLERHGLAGRPYVAYVGRIDREKRVFDCLDLAGALRRLRPGTLVAVAGDGPDRAAFEAEVARRGLGEAIRLLGPIENRLVRPLLAAGVAFIPISGYVLVEAALAGAPVVAYAIEWHDELVEDGATGRLVGEGDIEGVARAAADLLDRPGEARRLGEALRARARERHVPAVRDRAAAAFYEEVLACAG